MLAVAAALLAACTGGDMPVVTVAEVSSGTVTATVVAPGRIDAGARQDVAAGVSGTVADIAAVDGARVVAGQPVVRLESAQVDLAQQQAAAAVEAAQVPTGIAAPTPGGATRDATRAAVAELDAVVGPQIAAARDAAEAVQDPQARAAALDAVETVSRAYRAARSTLSVTGEALAVQQDELAGAIATALNQALALAAAPQEAQAQAAAAAARAQTGELVLRAPFDGTVQLGQAAASDGLALPAELADLAGGLGAVAGGDGGGTLQEGAPVVAGQVLFTVYDLSTVVAIAQVDEIDITAVAPGQPAVVTADAVRDQPLAGVVERVQVEATRGDTARVAYPVRIRLDDHPALEDLRVGMTAGVEITVDEVAGDRVVPSRALLRRDGREVVLAVRDGRIVEVTVEVLALGQDRAAVQGALSGRDQVVVDGTADLAAGDRVLVGDDGP